MVDRLREDLSRLFQTAGIEYVVLDAPLVHFSIHGQHSLAGILATSFPTCSFPING